MLRNALAAARTLLTDCGDYQLATPGRLALIEPSIVFDSSQVASAGVVSVRPDGRSRLVLATVDDLGGIWCIADDLERGVTTYGTVDAATSSVCQGGW